MTIIEIPYTGRVRASASTLRNIASGDDPRDYLPNRLNNEDWDGVAEAARKWVEEEQNRYENLPVGTVFRHKNNGIQYIVQPNQKALRIPQRGVGKLLVDLSEEYFGSHTLIQIIHRAEEPA